MIVTDKSVLRPTDGPEWRITAAAEPVHQLIGDSAIPLVAGPSVDTYADPPLWARTFFDDVDPDGIRRLEVRTTRPTAIAALEKLRS